MHICSTSRRVADSDASPDCIDKRAHCLPRKLFIVGVLLTLMISGCSLYRHYQASKPEAVRKTEAALSDAGFSTIKLDTADKVGLVEDLPPDEIRSYAAQSGTVYWYYDPDICACVYEGHQAEFDRYQMAQRQQSDTAQYAAESEDQQVASLNALNGTFFSSTDNLGWRILSRPAFHRGRRRAWRWCRRRSRRWTWRRSRALAGRIIALSEMGRGGLRPCKQLSPSMLTYAITIFIGAFLLFQVEPLLARYILPWFGGSSAVWITCMLFFQLLLVVGYAYSHLIATRLRPRTQPIVHITIISACVLLMGALALIWQSPITPGPSWKPAGPDFPITGIFILLIVSVGLPFFILSTTGPLLQAWFARSRHGASPYRLYALSNIGSLLALVTYPFLVEPALTLKAQAILWSLLFLGFAVGVALCARSVGRLPQSDLHLVDGAESEDARVAVPSRSTRILWIALATVASVMLLATTNQICQQVAVVPFLWVLPLAIYLLSFIVCFDNQRWYRRGVFHPALGAAVFWHSSFSAPRREHTHSNSHLLGVATHDLHGLSRRVGPAQAARALSHVVLPDGRDRWRTGGIFVVAIAPWLFTGYWEFHLAIWTSLLMLIIVLMRDPNSWIHRRRPGVAIALLCGAIVLPQLIGAHHLGDAIRRAGAHLIPGIRRGRPDVSGGVPEAVATHAQMARFNTAGERHHGFDRGGRRVDSGRRGESRQQSYSQS